MSAPMLASDDANTQFLGAKNPDSALHVEFYNKPVKQPYKSAQDNMPVYETVAYVKIFTPGNALNIIDTPVREDHKRRFPVQWAYFQNKNTGGEMAGLPVSQWPLIDMSLAETLKALKFYTVESVAFASDEQIGRIGMAAGMAPFSFRDRAKSFLQVAKDANALQKKDAELADMKKQLEELTALVKGQVKPVEIAEAPKEASPVDADRADLAKQYEVKFGKKPHHKLGVAKIREALAA